MQVPRLSGDRVVLRPLEEADAAGIAAIGEEPAVAPWWPGLTMEKVLAEARGQSEATSFAVELEGELIGLAQYWEESDPDHRHAGIDLCLTTAKHGQGLGIDTVRTLARHLVDDLGHHRVVIDPALANERAIRCYERVGFRRVGVLRRYERGPDEEWRDGLLLELMAEELG